MRSLPPDFDQAVVAEIDRRLQSVRDQGVTIAFAIESGSRSWGFPSPDSDYDCRFVYVRPPSDHFSLNPHRDVIEFPIDGLVDTGGWDLRKAINLALGGNAIPGEWVAAPIAYEELEGFRTAFAKLLTRIVMPVDVAHHYRGLANSQLKLLGSLRDKVKLKKVFYLLRPLLALEWMQSRSFSQIPPMDLASLRQGIDIPANIEEKIDALLTIKSRTREMGEDHINRDLVTFLETLNERFALIPERNKISGLDERQDLAQTFYSDWVMRLEAGI